MHPLSVDLSRILDHPSAYLSYDRSTKWLYVNLMPQVKQHHTIEVPGTTIVAEVDRDGRTIGLSLKWDPTTGGPSK